MLVGTILFLSSTVFLSQSLFLYSVQRFQFADTGDTAHVTCISKEKIEGNGSLFRWYKRREGGGFALIKRCRDKGSAEKYSCKVNGHNLTLEIHNLQSDDSGLYFCGQRVPVAHNESYRSSSLVVVGDSYTPNTQVMLFKPHGKDLPSQPQEENVQLACLVQGASNFVQVFWHFPGGLWHEAQTSRGGNHSGSLTFLSLLHLPVESQIGGERVTCEVRFNSSGNSTRKTIEFSAASSRRHQDGCRSQTVLLAVSGTLASLLLLLSVFWVRFCPIRQASMKSQRRVCEEPADLNASEEELWYAELDFAPKPGKKCKRR